MLNCRFACLALASCLVACAEPPAAEAPPPAPPPPVAPMPKRTPPLPYPETRIVDAKDVHFGVEVKDPYRWLEDAKDPLVQTWMTAEDKLARDYLAKLPERDAIAGRLKELSYIDSVSAPRRRGTRFFYTRRHADKEKSVVYWKEGAKGTEKVLFDPNTWSKDGSVTLGGWQASWDGKKVAYQVKENNSDEAKLFLVDVATGKKSDVDTIVGAKYANASWTPTGDGFYYAWLPTDPKIPEAERPGYAEIRFHKLGTDPKTDRVVREKTGDPSKFLDVDLSRDGRWLTIAVYDGWTSNDLYFADLKAPNKALRPLVVGRKAHFSSAPFKDKFYLLTDDGAAHGKIYVVDPLHAERDKWKEIVAERQDATLESFELLGGQIVTKYLKDASSRMFVHGLDGKIVREIVLPGVGSVGGPVGLPEDDTFYWSFESFTTPSEIQATSVKTGKSSLYAKVKVPVDPSGYVVDQEFATSKDGTRVSMFVVHKKDAKKDGSSRVYLYGYGGFQVSETPSFVGSAFPWLERGGVFVVANLRGGGEYGEAWHRAGMLTKKQNVFDDFIAAAEHLAKSWGHPGSLTIAGASNGGLLIGATVVQRPDLFGAALCGVPLLDMVRYHLFGAGKTWISEYGSADDEQQFKALYAYSPYHHVKDGVKYPAVLLASADSDDRVDPMHARKFAAELQAASAGGPVILRIEKHSGHGGADLVKANVAKRADELAFALANTK